MYYVLYGNGDLRYLCYTWTVDSDRTVIRGFEEDSPGAHLREFLLCIDRVYRPGLKNSKRVLSLKKQSIKLISLCKINIYINYERLIKSSILNEPLFIT